MSTQRRPVADGNYFAVGHRILSVGQKAPAPFGVPRPVGPSLARIGRRGDVGHARFEQLVPKVAAALRAVLYVEQPDPAPLQTLSDQPRLVLAETSEAGGTGVDW